MKLQKTYILLLSICFINSCIAAHKSILQEIENHTIGEITFVKDALPPKDYSKKDILSSFDLKDCKDLNIRFFLDKPLVHYFQKLDTKLPAEDLLAKGNFQFSFYVDNTLIYKENLNQGAGTIVEKSTATVFRKPFISSTNEDSWGRFLWMRFMKRGGGEESLTEGSHSLKIEIRPYLETPDIITGNIIAKGEITVNVVKPKVTEEQIKVQSIAPDSGWIISENKYDTQKIKELNKKILQEDFKDITSIVVIKNQKLLLEEYFNGADRTTLHDTRSVGKSFASTLLGIAIEDKYIKDENQTLHTFYTLKNFKNYSAEKETVTIKDLLMMRSGIDGDDSNPDSPGNEENMYPTPNWLQFALDQPMNKESTNDKKWSYYTAGVIILGDIINKKVPDGLEKYAHKNLFAPLGIQNYQWEYTPQKVANTAGGLRMCSLDYAKYGQLYKNNGVWNKNQILPKKWVQTSLAPQIGLPHTKDEFYGYLFWNKKYTINNISYEVSYCSGNGGNKIFIFKDLPLVIVITAIAYNKPNEVDKIMKEYLLPAIID